MGNKLLASIVVNVVFILILAVIVGRKMLFRPTITVGVPGISNIVDIRKSTFDQLNVDTSSIVLLGDSYTQYFESSEFLKNKNIANRGIAGDGSAQVLERLGRIVEGHPKKIFILVGINDLAIDMPVTEVSHNIEEIVNMIRQESPITRIYLEGVIPVSLKSFYKKRFLLPDILALNKDISLICKRYGLTYVDLYSRFLLKNGLNPKYDCGDHLHLNGNGYVVWSRILKPFVE